MAKVYNSTIWWLYVENWVQESYFFTKMFRDSVRIFKWWRIVRVLPIHIAYAWRHERTHAQESFYKQLYTHTQTFIVALWVLASFSCQGEGHNVLWCTRKLELRFRCELEPFNVRNANSICLKCPMVPKHLVREASAHLAPLLISGFHAEGWVLLFVLHMCWSLTSSWLFGYTFSFNFTRLTFRS